MIKYRIVDSENKLAGWLVEFETGKFEVVHDGDGDKKGLCKGHCKKTLDTYPETYAYDDINDAIRSVEYWGVLHKVIIGM